MFLGEYFKETIDRTWSIDRENTESSKANEGMIRYQQEYLITKDIMNHLATACKKYIEKDR